jgi:hypothetical protein
MWEDEQLWKIQLEGLERTVLAISPDENHYMGTMSIFL